MDSSSIRNIPAGIVTALKRASKATGADFDYLLKTAVRESALKPGAKAKTSSASGLFQFIEQTWLGTLKNAGGKHGLGKLAAMIHQDRNGKFQVTDPRQREAVLALRFDPKLSALMAGEFTRTNDMAMRQRIGRAPTEGELYIGHFLGAGKASRLINLARTNPNVAADRYFPRAARANKAIFYSQSGKARSVAAVYQNLTRHYSNEIARFSSPASSGGKGGGAERETGTSTAERPLTRALYTLWRSPESFSGGEGAGSAFHNLFLPGQAPGTGGSASTPLAVPPPATGSGKAYIPSAEAFLSAFNSESGDAEHTGNTAREGGSGPSPPAAPETQTAAGRVGVWGEKPSGRGLLARRRPGAI